MFWHLATNWIAGHWLLGAGAAVAVLACTPAGWAFLKLALGTQLGRMALLAALALGMGSWYGAARYAAGVRDTQAVADAATQKVSEAAREAEAARAGVFHSNEVAYERGREEARAAVAGVLDAVARGDYVLRDRFRCPVIHPAAPADSGRANDASASAWGLQGADVQFLVRFADDADAVSDQLRLCQSSLAADRAAIPARATVTP
jgi:hypothetical protein